MAKALDGGLKSFANRYKVAKEKENRATEEKENRAAKEKENKPEIKREGVDLSTRAGQNKSLSTDEKTALEKEKSEEAENLKKMYDAIMLAEGGDSKMLLVDGAMLLCQKGTTPTPLIVTPPTNVVKSEKQQANKMHCIAGGNFNNFGDCKVIKKPCSPSIVGPWMKSTSNGEAGHDMISMESFMVCAIGGLVLPLTSGLGMAMPGSVGTLNQAIIENIRKRYPELEKENIKKLFGGLTSAQLSLLIYGNDSPDKEVTIDDFIEKIESQTLNADDVIKKFGFDTMVDVEMLLAWSELLGVQTREITKAQIDSLYEPLEITEEVIDLWIEICKEEVNTLAPAHPMPGSNYFTAHSGIEYADTKFGYETHTGVDMGMFGIIGLPVRATMAGTVDRAGINKGYSIDTAFGFYVRIIDGSGRKNIYGHLDGSKGEEGTRDSVVVELGDYVLPGQLLGISGNTGKSSGPHLHYEVQPKGKPEDSQGYLDPRDPLESLLPEELRRSK